MADERRGLLLGRGLRLRARCRTRRRGRRARSRRGPGSIRYAASSVSSAGSSRRSDFASWSDEPASRERGRRARAPARRRRPRPPRASAKRSPSTASADLAATGAELALAPRHVDARRPRSAPPGAPRRASSTRASRLRNSKRRKISFSCERSGGASTSAAGSTSIVEVAPHRREQLRVARLLGVLAHRLRARRRELVDVLEHALERPVLRDQLPGRLVADPGNAGDVVRGVALEADEVRHLLGRDAVARLDALGRVDVDVRDAARRHHQADVLRAELERVAVGRDDAGLDPRLVGARGERRDHVVGLPALELEVPVAERLDDRAEVRELLAQEVGHRPPLGLVLRRQLRAVHGPRVPGDRDALRPVVGEQLEEHVGEAEQRVRREALGSSRAPRAARRTPGRRGCCRRRGRARRRAPARRRAGARRR